MYFNKADEIFHTAEKLEKQIQGTDNGSMDNLDDWCSTGEAYKFIAGIILYNAVDDFRSIFILLEHNLFNGAFLSLRRLFELNVDLKFIGKNPKIRSKEFLMFGEIQRGAFLKIREKYLEKPTIDTKRKENILADYKKAMDALGYKDLSKPPQKWARESWFKKCKEIKWLKYYEMVYELCCSYTHPNAKGFGSFIKPLPNGDLGYIEPEILLHIIAPLAMGLILGIMDDVNKIFNAGLEIEINNIYEKIRPTNLDVI